MTPISVIQQSGIYPNEATQCNEAWVVNPETGEKIMLSTCSFCVSEDQYQWWVQEMCRSLEQTETVA